MALISKIDILREPHSSTPSHHVVTTPKTGWSSILPAWSSSDDAQATSTGDTIESIKTSSAHSKPAGFKNPWPSWHKANRQEIWNSLEWGNDQDPCIRLAAQHPRAIENKSADSPSSPSSPSNLVSTLLKVQKPDFTFDAGVQRFKVTWLGHAGILLQLPPIQAGGRPFRCVFDPFFSLRCSPNQFVGPLRTYPAPCQVEDLPEIDVVMISHNHYDHLDYDTIMSLWKCNQDTIRFLVPFGNGAWFQACGIPEERVVDLDWWDMVRFHISASESIQVTCTPSQHNSGRTGYAPNSTLWSSWYITYPLSSPLRVFFGGDTGFQYHDSPNWPPTDTPGPTADKPITDEDVNGAWPTCPAFEEIAERLGAPELLLLPVAVGATYDYLRSFVPLPNSISPFPRHRPGVTGANHMPPWDAVRVFQLMTAHSEQKEAAVAVAIHWGTFVTDIVEVLKTLGQLENACERQGAQFARSMEESSTSLPNFLALDHGQSISR